MIKLGLHSHPDKLPGIDEIYTYNQIFWPKRPAHIWG